jgi:hypothetical protein
VADEKYFYHVLISPFLFCISSQNPDITGFFTFPGIFEISAVFGLSSQIFPYFLMFFSAILVNSLVKLGALPMSYL